MSALASQVGFVDLPTPALEMVELLGDARLAGAPAALRAGATAVAAVQATRDRPWAPAASVPATLAGAADAMLSAGTGEVDPDAIAALIAAERAEAEAQAATEATAALRTAVLSRWPAVIAAHRDALLGEVLAPMVDQMAATYADLAPVAAQLDPDDLDALLAAPDAPRHAYAALSAMAREHEWVRGVQRTVLDAAAGRAGAYRRLWERGLAETRRARSLPQDPRARLVAVMSSGSPWVPTLEQMLAADTAHTPAPQPAAQDKAPARVEPGDVHVPAPGDLTTPTTSAGSRGMRHDGAARPVPAATAVV